MDEWLKILISTLAGMLSTLALEPLKGIYEKHKLRKRLYYEIVYMYRALAVGLATYNNFILGHQPLTPALEVERVKLITAMQADFNRSLTFEIFESAKTKTPEFMYDLPEFAAVNAIYGRVKLLNESMAEPNRYAYYLKRAIWSIEQAIYDGTFRGLLIEDVTPDNMKTVVRSLIYKEREPSPGKLVIDA
jgi:hypothetical protein